MVKSLWSFIKNILANKYVLGTLIVSTISIAVHDQLEERKMIEDNGFINIVLSTASYPVGIIGSIPNPVKLVGNILGMDLAGGIDSLGVSFFKARYSNSASGTSLLKEHVTDYLERYNRISEFKREAVQETVEERLKFSGEPPFDDKRATVMFYKVDQIATGLDQDTATYLDHVKQLGQKGNTVALQVLGRLYKKKRIALEKKEAALVTQQKQIIANNETSFILATQAGASSYVKKRLNELEGESVDKVIDRISSVVKRKNITLPSDMLKNIRDVLNNAAKEDGNPNLNTAEARKSVTGNPVYNNIVKGLEFKGRHFLRQAVLIIE